MNASPFLRHTSSCTLHLRRTSCLLVNLRLLGALCLAAVLCFPAEPSAAQLYKEGRKAESAGDVVRAYLLYSSAAAKDPANRKYWARSESLRTKAALKARPLPASALAIEAAPAAPEPPPPGFSNVITPDDLAEVRRLLPPPALKPKPGRITLDLRGDAKVLFEKTTSAFGLDIVFDGDFQAGQPRSLHLKDVDYRDALHAVEAATGSFVFPVGERLLMAAADTQQKRASLEPHVAVTVPIPYTVTPQEAQELGRSVQQSMDITKFAVDASRNMVLIKDRISKVRPAQALFEQLTWGKPQVEIEMQFLEVDRSTITSYGLLLPNNIPIPFIGANSSANTLVSLAQLFLGKSLFGVGIADSQLFATMSRSFSRTLLTADVRSLDGATATFHVGDKYPIATATFLGTGDTTIPPSFSFEDLGLLLKVTPHVHATSEVSLDLNAEFKLLGGQSSNGIPIISNRKLESKVRLRHGQWAIVAGLMTVREARAISGIWGLSSIPLLGHLFRKNDVERSSSEVLMVIKPRLMNLPPTELVTRTLWVGSDARLQIPL